MRWNSFFYRNNLFTRDFDWYKLHSFSQSFTALSSLDTFNTMESDKHNRIALLSLLYNLSQSSCEVAMSSILGSTTIHCSRSTIRSSILSFHSSKFWSLNFSIWILKLLAILFQCTNQHYKDPTEPRFIIDPRSINCIELSTKMWAIFPWNKEGILTREEC